jgi:hypothetical protein
MVTGTLRASCMYPYGHACVRAGWRDFDLKSRHGAAMLNKTFRIFKVKYSVTASPLRIGDFEVSKDCGERSTFGLHTYISVLVFFLLGTFTYSSPNHVPNATSAAF